MPSSNGTGTLEEDMLEDELQTELTDESYAELAQLEGATVLAMAFWESSLVDELEEQAPSAEERTVVDLDIYLDDYALLELYGASLYTTDQGEPVMGVAAIEDALMDLADSESVLSEVAQTDDGSLALIFAADEQIQLIITVSAWVISEWEELPED